MGRRIAEVIAVERISMREFARRVGISSGHLSAVVRDQKTPGGEFLSSVKREFGISVDWLLSGEGDMYSRGLIDERLFDHVAFDVELAFRAWVDREDLAVKLWAGRFDPDAYSRAVDLLPETRDAYIRDVFEFTQRARAAASIYNRTAHLTDSTERARAIYTEANVLAMLFRKPDIANELRRSVSNRVNELVDEVVDKREPNAITEDAFRVSQANLSRLNQTEGRSTDGSSGNATDQVEQDEQQGNALRQVVQKVKGKSKRLAGRDIGRPKTKKRDV